MPSKNTYYSIEYTEAGGPIKNAVVRGTGGKSRVMKILKEIHPDWWIEDMKRIKRPDWIKQAD